MKTTALLLILITAGFGCISEKSEPGKDKTDYKIEYVDESGIRSLTANRNGKILLLNVWATWCPPCVEEFPDLVKLANDINNSKYEIIGISVDDPGDADGKVIPFIKRYRVPFKIYIANAKNQEDLMNTFNVSWNGAIPATFFYNTAGRQHSFVIGSRSYEQFSKLLAEVK
ncbi:MAG: TlpA family protein disulfide reductase [Bacteroidetes bacterium]|nr:TlpA family protein disulfide reductase [Bacteroidota bacterium]